MYPALIIFLAIAAGMPVVGEGAPAPSSPPLANRLLVIAGSGSSQTDLGSWAKVDGLGVSFIVGKELGHPSNHRWYKPGNTKFQTVKLTRAASSESRLIGEWLAQMASSGEPTTITIVLVDGARNVVTRWQLYGVLPVKWSVSGSGASRSVVETLELSHQGFLDN
ncbi:MAG: hypothetical protein GEU75_03715 [Dehalococcoidia bacterium]|nr:hypothetical protein [Dehalococcoidia bacterium]